MSINSQQYANLTHHAYGEEADGKKGQMQHLVGEKVTLEGVSCKVLENMDQPAGYQGAIYQRVDTGEIGITHYRGTSPTATQTGNVQHQGFGLAIGSAATLKKFEIRRRRLWLGVGLMLSLSACNLSTPSGSKPVADYKKNPTPQQRYDVTLTIADAPGTFASMEGSAQYEVVNLECLPPPNSNSGGYTSRMTRHVSFALTPVSETDYTAVVYADQLLDEDYHGRGICHWQLTHVGVKLMATGAKGETKFLPSISLEALSAQQSKQLYFLKQFYPRTETRDFPDIGVAATRRNAALPENAWFSITLAAKRNAP